MNDSYASYPMLGNIHRLANSTKINADKCKAFDFSDLFFAFGIATMLIFPKCVAANKTNYILSDLLSFEPKECRLWSFNDMHITSTALFIVHCANSERIRAIFVIITYDSDMHIFVNFAS